MEPQYNGFLIVNKPLGRTSSNVVVHVRKRLPRGTAVGHGGTLDPDASGVLPICIGPSTRLFDYIIDKKKTYVAELRLGVETDTQDASGQVVRSCEVSSQMSDVQAVLSHFVGEIEQIPPMYSALKRDGRRLYDLARKGETVELEPRKRTVHSIEYLEQVDEVTHRIRISCGKGVYIRTLCHDIGRVLGCGGHMASLERTEAGIFAIADAYTPDDIDAMYQEGRLAEALLPPDAPLQHLPAVYVGEERLHAVKNGNPLKAEWLKAPAEPNAEAVRVYCGKQFAGIGKVEPDGSVRFRAMLLQLKQGGENHEDHKG